ncbi:BnaAnng22730D [Brassica napus]|uniref:(rape) hypothetical protein n=1 Tax=Brassica napus TaxID=3708 RepID=A0A078JGE6_BRANA|nr:unnamed protein product [Brassica napus]CDY66683.1 BnaAnng22730D [Brassica napus]
MMSSVEAKKSANPSPTYPSEEDRFTRNKPTKEEVEKAKKEMNKMKMDIALGREVEEKNP